MIFVDLLIKKLVEFNWKRLTNDWKEIDFEIDNTVLTLKYRSLYDRGPNMLESNFELSTIPFGDPNCLLLLQSPPFSASKRPVFDPIKTSAKKVGVLLENWEQFKDNLRMFFMFAYNVYYFCLLS